LRFIFGQVEDKVMSGCLVYFLITVISYPFLALFNAGAAFFRAGGNSKFPMKVSVISNIINIIGNAIFIYVFKWNVAGAALSTLMSRAFCTIVIYYYLRKPRQIIVVKDYLKIRPDMPLIWKIMSIGVPSGIENGMFQFGKLAIQSTVSTMGTVAIAAQAMTNIMENVNGVFGIGVGIGLMTVVGQCIGAGRTEEAKYYIVKLTKIAWVGILCSCLLVLAITKPVTWLAGMETESAALCFEMVKAITVVKPLVWVGSFIIAYGLRAAGDVKFSMTVSTLTMWFCRVALCIFLVRVYNFGPMAVWIGMFADWTIRTVIFTARFLSGKWLKHQVV
jgi:putative MATE family efflux protein